MIDWAIVILPVLISVLVVFARAPEAGHRLGKGWRISIAVLGVITAFLAYQQHKGNEQDKVKLLKELENLRTVSPLRKQAADLAKELLEFYNSREHYNDRFKAGHALSDKETSGALKWYGETVRLYHVNYERRIINVLEEIHTVTGMDVASLESDAKRVEYAPHIGEIATRLGTFAVSLP